MASNRLCSKNEILKKGLLGFFSNFEHSQRVVPIINHTNSEVSLRVLDWFVTNYAKRYHIVYDIETLDGKTEKFDVFRSYKAELKTYSKKNFDPFRRKHGNDRDDSEILLYYSDEFGKAQTNVVKTRVRQLNFFRWAILNGILDYVEDHKDTIEEDMIKSNNRKKKDNSIVVKKNKTTITAARTFTKNYSKITVTFE